VNEPHEAQSEIEIMRVVNEIGLETRIGLIDPTIRATRPPRLAETRKPSLDDPWRPKTGTDSEICGIESSGESIERAKFWSEKGFLM
jgi:hypothetical protein